jgi:hypothetical protein
VIEKSGLVLVWIVKFDDVCKRQKALIGEGKQITGEGTRREPERGER